MTGATARYRMGGSNRVMGRGAIVFMGQVLGQASGQVMGPVMGQALLSLMTGRPARYR